MAALATADPFRPQAPRGMGRGAVLALLVHGGLVVALALAVKWRASTPAPMVAELWSTVAQEAAPREQTPPEPEPEPVRKAPPPPPAKAEPPADIALKKAREAEKKEAERKAAEERKRELAEKEKQRQREREKEREKERERERLKERERQKAEKAAEERAEKLRQENLARIRGMAGASGGAEATGSAAQSSGPSAGYAGRIKARIKPLIVYPDTLPGNPVAEVEVRLSPTGAILGQRLLRKSDSPEWDAAVMRAVEKAEVLPRDVDGRVPPVIVIQFSRRE
jgi:colicin import membrane protein